MNEIEKEEYIAYLNSRKSSNRHNYYKSSVKFMEQLKKENKRPKLLLHVCCIVCACWPLDFLSDTFDVTVIYDNSNIWPKSEYDHRLSEVRRYIHEKWNDTIPIIELPYDYDTYEQTVLSNRANDPEGWKSCFGCYASRMKRSMEYAERNGYEYFTSVLTFSRQKDSEKINEIGMQIVQPFPNVKYLCTDFKKGNGQQKSDDICNAYNIYRQDYCGCRYSYFERHPNEKSM